MSKLWKRTESARFQWVESSVFFDTPKGKQVLTPLVKAHVGTHVSPTAVLVLFSTFCIFFLFLLTRLFYIQIVRGQDFEQFADRNSQRILPIPAERGHMFDRRSIQLTENIPSFSLALVPQDLPRDVQKRQTIVERLSKLTGQDTSLIAKTIDEYGDYSYESITIVEDIPYDTALSIHIAAADLPGISIQRGSKRLYLPLPYSATSTALSHVLGYQGKLNREELDQLYQFGYLPSDTIGKTGVEKTYETVLRGVYGKKRVEVDALGREQAVLSEDSPQPGSHIRLNIDLDIQKQLAQIMRERLTQENKTRGAAVALDPLSGEVLALVNFPTFDNNDFSGGIDYETYQSYISNPDQPLFHRAISGTYPSGSTIKPAIASAALSNGIITAQTSFVSSGGIRIGQWFFPDWQAGGHGVTNVRKSLAQSVNTFYYYIGGGFGEFVGLGVEKITAGLRQFGFAHRLGIDLPGEQAGFLPSKEWKEKAKNERWYIGDTYNLSIGQGGLLVTPLQIAMMTSVVANGGTLFEPHIVNSIINPQTKEETPIPIKKIRQTVMPASDLAVVRLGMRDCVMYGSCRRLSTISVPIAGKTGTAQWSSEKLPHAWFTSFAPFDNPRIVLTIIVEEGGEGSSVAVPIADSFYRWWVTYVDNLVDQAI